MPAQLTVSRNSTVAMLYPLLSTAANVASQLAARCLALLELLDLPVLWWVKRSEAMCQLAARCLPLLVLLDWPLLRLVERSEARVTKLEHRPMEILQDLERLGAWIPLMNCLAPPPVA